MAERSEIRPLAAGDMRSPPHRGDRVTLAYRRLRELIVTGRLAPGSRIIETAVAARLGVSRTPVRAALQRLQQEGYVVVASPGQQSRMAVAPLTQEDAIELFGMVSAVEGLAANGAARRRRSWSGKWSGGAALTERRPAAGVHGDGT
jgi:DNA-binding GntR family transcriptional regulator